MKRYAALSSAAGALVTAAILAALVLAPAAAAYTWDQLPSLGYSLSVGNLANGCHDVSASYGTTVAKTHIGNDCDTGFQASLDAFVAATCPCAQPPATTTVPATPAPPATTTDTTPTPAPPPSTTTVTTVVAAPLPAPPMADFAATAETNAYVIDFADASTSSSALGSRVWQFGDGSAGTGSAPTHAYAGPGSYGVTLIVVDSAGLAALAVRQITINADHSVVVGPRTTQSVGVRQPTTTTAPVTVKQTVRFTWPRRANATATYTKILSGNVSSVRLSVYGIPVERGLVFGDHIVACAHRGPSFFDWDWKALGGGGAAVKFILTTGMCTPGVSVAGKTVTATLTITRQP